MGTGWPEIDEYVRREQEAARRLFGRQPFMPAGFCPLADSVGTPYDWSLICSPPWMLTGAIVDEAVDVGNKVVGSGLLVEPRVVITAARVIQGRDVGNLRFAWPSGGGRAALRRSVVDAQTPRSGVRYSDPVDLAALVSVDSSDIALLRLEDGPSSWESPSPRWVNLGASPNADRVAYLRQHPEARGAVTLHSWADAIIPSYYRESLEVQTPVRWLSVAGNGSVLVAWTTFEPGATTSYVPGSAYSPGMDRGAPAVQVSAAIRPEAVGVVSGYLSVPSAGTFYRITRCDRWAGWIGDTLARWFPGAAPTVPFPDVPPLPAATRPRSQRRGSLLAATITLAVGAGAGLWAAK